jgi:hypothetical protein
MPKDEEICSTKHDMPRVIEEAACHTTYSVQLDLLQLGRRALTVLHVVRAQDAHPHALPQRALSTQLGQQCVEPASESVGVGGCVQRLE